MKLSELKEALQGMNELKIKLPDGTLVPQHFHLTELGKIRKEYMDCGGKRRDETVISVQLWVADDIDHRLAPEKFLKIIALAEKSLDLFDSEIEVEYQQATIGKFGLAIDGAVFKLVPMQTACLAMDQCGIVPQKTRVRLSELKQFKQACCQNSTSC
jgi:hypothetical protein